MALNREKRDYSITGSENKRAQERGLAEANWYATPIPRQRMKELMKRKNGPAIRDTVIWFGGLVLLGYLAYLSWGTWWAVPAFLAYGILYSTPGDSRWHECGHGTAFKTPWMNEVLYQIATFFVLRSATPWRWSHVRHHTDTIIVGRDPEIYADLSIGDRGLRVCGKYSSGDVGHSAFLLWGAPRDYFRSHPASGSLRGCA